MFWKMALVLTLLLTVLVLPCHAQSDDWFVHGESGRDGHITLPGPDDFPNSMATPREPLDQPMSTNDPASSLPYSYYRDQTPPSNFSAIKANFVHLTFGTISDYEEYQSKKSQTLKKLFTVNPINRNGILIGNSAPEGVDSVPNDDVSPNALIGYDSLVVSSESGL